MKDLILKLVAKASGVGKLLEGIAGKKTYIAGVGLILVGAGHLLGSVASIDLTSLSAVLDLVKDLPSHPGTRELLEGFGLVGLRHAISTK